jgi:formylglycine-generating enzyme required for sulfatase activity
MTHFFCLSLVVALASGFPIQAQPKKDPPKNFTNSIGMKFVWIPPGNFMMGSPVKEEKRDANEVQHKVTLTKGFYMSVYTVTQEEWQAVMGNNPSQFKDEKNLPVEKVSWDDCQEFSKKLREKEKKPYRLPTEAEWEYACRAGTTTPFHFGESISTDQANYNGTITYGTGKIGKYREKTIAVGSFPANAWGLHDMHGNVFQWCQDWLGDYPQKDLVDPQGPESGKVRVLRGGTWIYSPGSCRSACRYRDGPGERSDVVGFRVCFFVEQSEATPKPPVIDEPQRRQKELPKNLTNTIGMKFVWIPPGTFAMGSPKKEAKKLPNETQHKVTLTKGFYMAVYSVTQEQWKEIMGNNPSKFKGEMNLPVETVSWDDCQEFIKELRKKDKKPYRLPAEAEREYACRAGTKTPFYFGNTLSTEQANYNGNYTYGNGKEGVYRKKSTPVGRFSANAWGLHDLHGNLWEWCQDWYGDYAQEDVVDPQGPDAGKNRVLRGGSWIGDPLDCRSAFRFWGVPGYRSSDVGFRLCFFGE